MVPRCLHYEVRKGLHQRQNEVIGMLCFDSELRKSGAVKSTKLSVTITLAPHRIAAART